MKNLLAKKKEAKAKTPPPKNKRPISPPIDRNKKKIVAGLTFIIAAFVGVIAIFYVMMHKELSREKSLDKFKAQILALSAEKDLAETKIADLEQDVAQIPELDKIIAASSKIHGKQERDRKEGFLWIDRKGQAMIATLGALNGVTPGSRLTVFDGDTKIGYVRVDLAMDVISYVVPDRMALSDFKKDYYRVLKETP
jgi:hypothetical protein